MAVWDLRLGAAPLAWVPKDVLAGDVWEVGEVAGGGGWGGRWEGACSLLTWTGVGIHGSVGCA